MSKPYPYMPDTITVHHVVTATILAAMIGVYVWVFYVTREVNELTVLVYGTHDDDSRQDAQLDADKATIASHRTRLNAMDDRVNQLAREQTYLREASRHAVSSMTILNERLRVAITRQDKIIDTITGSVRMNMPPPPDLNTVPSPENTKP